MSLFLKKYLVILAGLTSLAVDAAGIAADQAKPGVRIESVKIGFNGVYKSGHWTPVWVTLANAGPGADVRLQIAARDSEGVEAILVRAGDRPLRLNADGKTVALQYVKSGRVGSGMKVRVVGDRGELAERALSAGELGPAAPSTQELIVGFSPSIGLEEAARKARRDRSQAVAIATVADPTALPADWYGYEAVDIVVATTGEAGVLEKLTEAQFEALDRWLQLGGRMVLCVGHRGAEVFAPGSRMARFSPGTDVPGQSFEVLTQRVTSGLETYAGTSERLDTVGGQRSRRFGVAITAFPEVRGLIECSEVGGSTGRLPTIVRFPYGLGQIAFLAFDPELPPFDAWQGRAELMARVLQIAGPGQHSRGESDSRQGQIAHLGYEDLAGQLRASLDQFSGVTRVPFSWIAGLLALYIVLIGPADYFLLKRFRRLTWTWLTSSLIAVVFCLLAYGVMHRLAGRQVHVNQVDLVDVDLAQGILRGSVWVHVYSPMTDKFSLAWTENWPMAIRNSSNSGRLLAWQGLPGGGLGGVDSRAAGTTLFAEPYTTSSQETRAAGDSLDSTGRAGVAATGDRRNRPGTDTAGGPDAEPCAAISDLPIEVSGTKSLFGAWWVLGQPSAEQRLTASVHGLLTGQLTNPLECELTDCMVLYENWMYPVPGTLSPGKAVMFDGVSPRNLEWHLSRRRVVDSKDVGTPWDQASSDVPRILEMMMFYQAAGGAAYTGLTHRYQPSLDLSEHMRTGRAILVGRSTAAGSRLDPQRVNWDPSCVRQWAFYRVVFPVDRSERTAVP
jgi:hypothetical protein